MQKDITLNMEVWTLNQIYDKVFNCVAVKPPYEWDKWIYNQNFFLDKRLWLTSYSIVSWYEAHDHITANWTDYYLLDNGTQSKLYADNGTTLTEVAWPFATNSNSPKKLVKWFNAWWLKVVSWTITNPTNVAAPSTDLAFYWDWFVKLTLSNVTWVAVNQYIFFKDWVLAWWANKILYKTWSDVYILGTNTRGKLPLTAAAYDVYPDYKECVLMWWTAWLYTILLNWLSPAYSHLIITTAITDIVEFNSAFFILTDNTIRFSRKTFDDNCQFYVKDRFKANGIDKLCPAWKILFCNWFTNKIISPATDTDWVIWYLEYQANYDERLFSKYSFIYTWWTFYIINSQNYLRMLDIVTLNSTTYDIIEKEVTYNARWLFESIEWWVITTDTNDRFINFNNINWNQTVTYQYDKQLQHWLLHKFETKLYNYTSPKKCISWWVATEEWYTDLWLDYSQEVNFILNEPNRIMMPIFIRTLFWLTGDIRINLDLDISYQLWAMKNNLKLEFKNYAFDTNLDWWAEIDNLLWIEESNFYTWNTTSLQNKILRTWRYFLFTYSSVTRFILWPSYIQAKTSKPYINEFLLSN